ncbi:MAG TPA: PadR family transcriptional regulator [Solirubrobacteraceae bacterium]|jgi:DNA-binding PadR family transcriptional regulator|nr:PadR family transcriptional regulator [Solirubrobacteraceae bacterium]
MGAERVREQQGSMQSPVNWALLGLVIERESYAYKLAQRFDRTYEGALSLSSTSHVYTALRSLLDRGLVEEVPGSGTGRQPKPCYRATAAGLEEYQRWLVGQLSEERRRQRLFAMELAALMSEPELARAVIDGYEQECLREASKSTVGRGDGADDAGSQLAERLASEENRLAVGARLAWLQYVRSELRAIGERRPQGR